MKLAGISLVLVAVTAVSQATQPRRAFDPQKDLISLHYDHAPDLDDGQSAAADRTLLESQFGREWLSAHVVPVSGAYGKNASQFVPASDAVMDAAWNAGGWIAAHRNRTAAVEAIAERWIKTLKGGGDVWVKEGGQSDITAAVVARLATRAPDVDARRRVHVVQHSTWNEDQTTKQALAYTREHTDYIRIHDANTYLNVKGGDPAFVEAATSHPVFGSIWKSAFAYYDPAIRVDFSDTGELLHILGLGELGIREFQQRYLGAGRPGGGAFHTGRYRNLFAEAGRSQAEVRTKIDSAFQQLFHGDAANETVFYWSGENPNGRLAYLSDINNNDVRTEGMSYGMMIAVQLDRKAEFDALWNWSRTYMYHEDPKHPAFGFFSWSMSTDGTPRSESPAPDGEEYYATALYFASARWGDGTGIYDYHAAADRLLSDMKNRAVITGRWASRPERSETIGPEFNVEHKMVRFTPNLQRPDHTDPSYHLPAFYELWARWGPQTDRTFWAEAARVSRDFFQKTTNANTGFAPEYANFDGSPVTSAFNKRSSTFGPDAWRTAANWSVDWSWWAADPRERELSDRIQAFFESKGIASYGNRWTLDGTTELGTSHSTALVATNAIASLASTNPRAAKFVEELWNAPIPSGRYRYYDGMWYLMGLLHCSGEFRVIRDRRVSQETRRSGDSTRSALLAATVPPFADLL